MSNSEIVISSGHFFEEALENAFKKQNIQTELPVKLYLKNILEFFLVADNLFDVCEETGQRKFGTLAELYLKAAQSESQKKVALLKQLGDKSLYIAGFFAQSFKTKIIDIDYYLKMGESAYGNLAELPESSSMSQVYKEMSLKFSIYIDTFSYISKKSRLFDENDALALYELLKVDSELAKQKLAQMGASLKSAKF